MARSYTDLNKERYSGENLSSKEMKTTDVNILLNRVRLDKKKTFQKNVIVSLLLVGLISSICIYLII